MVCNLKIENYTSTMVITVLIGLVQGRLSALTQYTPHNEYRFDNHTVQYTWYRALVLQTLGVRKGRINGKGHYFPPIKSVRLYLQLFLHNHHIDPTSEGPVYCLF